jgi:hypothetical protein
MRESADNPYTLESSGLSERRSVIGPGVCGGYRLSVGGSGRYGEWQGRERGAARTGAWLPALCAQPTWPVRHRLVELLLSGVRAQVER